MSGFSQLEGLHEFLAFQPAKVTRRHKEIRREGAASELSAPKAAAVLEYAEVPADLIGGVST